MFCQLRRTDGSANPFSAGALIDATGGAHPFARADVRIEALSTWRSPHTGVTYPARWRLTDAPRALVLELTPRLADQELLVNPRYWEGAVVITRSDAGRPVAGHGYVEQLVGYGESQRAR